jgi:hypothetical protein
MDNTKFEDEIYTKPQLNVNVYGHSHFYFNFNGTTWTVRLQGEKISEEIFAHPGKINIEELDVGWRTIRSPFEQADTVGLPSTVVTGIETWVDYGYMMPIQKFINGLFGL